MPTSRFTRVLVALLVAAALTAPAASAQSGPTPTGRTETVTATLDVVSPFGGRYVGTIVAVRTEMRAGDGALFLDTQWTFDGTQDGHPERASGVVRERWTGTSLMPRERVELVRKSGKRELPVNSVDVTQTRPNILNVGGLLNIAIDGWLQPPLHAGCLPDHVRGSGEHNDHQSSRRRLRGRPSSTHTA